MTKVEKEIWEWGKAFLVALLAAFVIRTFLFTPIEVKGDSMKPTLINEERMIVTKVGEPKRFDIIVFQATEEERYIKRVIGLPGDRVEYKNDVLYVNGKAYEEPYLNKYKKEVVSGTLTDSFSLKETAVASETVPNGHLFVMGDNRRKSRDSREIGAVPMDKVIGTTNLVIWPLDEMKIIKK